MSLVETTQAERESWAALKSTPDEDGLQRLISDADRAAEFETVMTHIITLLRPHLRNVMCARILVPQSIHDWEEGSL
jgi:hypothetical protein